VDRQSGNSAFTAGQTLGDAVSLLQGGVEAVAGVIIAGGGTVGGVVTSPTGAGPVAGAVTAKVGVVAAVHGGNTALNAYENLVGDNKGRVYSNSTKSNGNNTPQGQSGNTHGNSPIDGAKSGGTSLTHHLESMGTNTKAAAEFFGWGSKTTLTKSIGDFTKEGLLKNGWTKENLVKLARAYNDQIVKAQLAGAENPAAVVRRDQARELAKTFFGK